MAFRHTQNLMSGLRDGKVIVEDNKDKQKFMDQLVARINVLQDLQRHPGWIAFCEEAHEESRTALRKLEIAQDPTSLSKLVGVHLALEGMKTWAQDRVAELSADLEELKKP